LLADGHDVWCLDDFSTGKLRNLENATTHPSFRVLNQEVEAPFPPELEVDQIYNLACPAAPVEYQRDPVKTMRTCVIGALNVLEAARKTGARVFQASTSEVYGDPEVHPQKETYRGSVNCTGVRSCYDEGKRAAETVMFDYHRRYGLEVRVARIFNVFGPRMDAQDGRVVPNFVHQALQDKDITIYGDGTQTRSLCYVDDIVEGVVRLMNARMETAVPVNLGNPRERTIKAVAESIVERTRSKSKITYHPLPQDDPRRRWPDIGRAQRLLGWQPVVSFDDGIAKTIEWCRENWHVGNLVESK
jgi:UDP-glucuronate decarboxylase